MDRDELLESFGIDQVVLNVGNVLVAACSLVGIKPCRLEL
jgi:hypothetical protein